MCIWFIGLQSIITQKQHCYPWGIPTDGWGQQNLCPLWLKGQDVQPCWLNKHCELRRVWPVFSLLTNQLSAPLANPLWLKMKDTWMDDEVLECRKRPIRVQVKQVVIPKVSHSLSQSHSHSHSLHWFAVVCNISHVDGVFTANMVWRLGFCYRNSIVTKQTQNLIGNLK